MVIEFKNIVWAFSSNDKSLESNLLKRYENKRYLSYLDNLFRILKENDCLGIQEKISDISLLTKFRNFISELEIARILIENGKSVHILPNSYNDMISPPDLLLVDKKYDVYIEVKRFLDDPIGYRIKEIIDDCKKLNNSRCYIIIELNKEFSAQFLNHDDLRKKEKLLEKLNVDEIDAGFKKINEKMEKQVEIDTIVGKITLENNSKYGDYYAIRSAPMSIDNIRVVDRLNSDLDKKASKREKWKGEHLDKFFIVAFDFHNFQYDDIFVCQALFGTSHHVRPPSKIPPMEETDEIKYAIKMGWKEFLLEKYIIPNNQVYIPLSERGSYFTNPNLKNVSGVLCKFGKRVHFTPNPFSHKEINDVELLKFI